MPAEKLVELYEMPMCGDPRVQDQANPVLHQVNAMVKTLEAEGATVKRYLPSEDMSPFLRNPKIAAIMREQRLRALPITMVNGTVIKVQQYPTVDEVRNALAEGSAQP